MKENRQDCPLCTMNLGRLEDSANGIKPEASRLSLRVWIPLILSILFILSKIPKP